jgi:hypothetical protein
VFDAWYWFILFINTNSTAYTKKKYDLMNNINQYHATNTIPTEILTYYLSTNNKWCLCVPDGEKWETLQKVNQ